MRATLLLLKRDPEGNDWAREGRPLVFEDDSFRTGDEKARAYGDEWVSADTAHRQYSVLPESHPRPGWTTGR